MDLCLLECFATQSLHYIWGGPNHRIVEELPLITLSADPSFSPNPLSSLAIWLGQSLEKSHLSGPFSGSSNWPCFACLMTCVPGVLRALLEPHRHHQSPPPVTLTPRKNHPIKWLFLGLTESLFQRDRLCHHLK